MCNLYANTMPADAMRQLFDVVTGRVDLGNMEPLTAIYPKYEAPVVTIEEGERVLRRSFWGFLTPNKSKKTGKWLKPQAWNNTRDDKIRSTGLWKDSFENRRCLIPASSYSEATGRNPATHHWFNVKGEEGFAFAGIWKHQTGQLGETEVDQHVYSMVTTEPNEFAAKYHNRMPAILQASDYETWLSGDAAAAFELLRPFDGELALIDEGEGMRSEPGAKDA